MTANQINYANLQELKRHNQTYESETRRHNVVGEGETYRHNTVQEDVSYVANKVAQQNADSQSWNALSNQMNAQSNAQNAKTNQYLASYKKLETEAEVAKDYAQAKQYDALTEPTANKLSSETFRNYTQAGGNVLNFTKAALALGAGTAVGTKLAHASTGVTGSTAAMTSKLQAPTMPWIFMPRIPGMWEVSSYSGRQTKA